MPVTFEINLFCRPEDVPVFDLQPFGASRPHLAHLYDAQALVAVIDELPNNLLYFGWHSAWEYGTPVKFVCDGVDLWRWPGTLEDEAQYLFRDITTQEGIDELNLFRQFKSTMLKVRKELGADVAWDKFPSFLPP